MANGLNNGFDFMVMTQLHRICSAAFKRCPMQASYLERGVSTDKMLPPLCSVQRESKQPLGTSDGHRGITHVPESENERPKLTIMRSILADVHGCQALLEALHVICFGVSTLEPVFIQPES